MSGVEDQELETNSEPFIGNGERCLPGDSDGCGDGGKAINARLTYPKGKNALPLALEWELQLKSEMIQSLAKF